MKKNYFNYTMRALSMLLVILLGGFAFTSCDDDNNSGSAAIKIAGIYLEDATASVTDRPVEFARLGQLIRVEGSGFTGLKRVYINGYSCYFNPVLVSDHSFLVTVNKNVPVSEAEANVRNKIQLVKDNTQLTYDFIIRSSAPSITSISNTMPKAGETIIIYGEGLQEISSITFPGDIKVEENIISDEDGKYCMVTVPDGITESGYLTVIGANGGVYSQSCFNYTKGMILDFDTDGQHASWKTVAEMPTMIYPEDLTTDPLSSGRGKCVKFPADRQSPVKSGNRLAEVWSGATATWAPETVGIPAETNVKDCGIQFEVYIPEATPWSGSGFIQVCLANNVNGGEWPNSDNKDCSNYVPWLVNQKSVPFYTSGWQTVTIPFSQFYCCAYVTKDGKLTENPDLKDLTYQYILNRRDAAANKQFGIMFNNSDFTMKSITGNDKDEATEFPSSTTSIQVYIDNVRIVPLTTPTYSDFPENNEEVAE